MWKCVWLYNIKLEKFAIKNQTYIEIEYINASFKFLNFCVIHRFSSELNIVMTE